MNKIESEFIHDDLYGTALKASEEFISTSITRPVLNYTQHKDNGDLIATDSHRLLHVKDIHGFKEEYLVSPKTFMFAKGRYPNVENILSGINYSSVVILSGEQIKLWLQIFKSINQIFRTMKDSTDKVELRFYDNSMDAYIESQNVSIQLPVTGYGKLGGLDGISLRPEYIRDALDAHVKLKSEELTLEFAGKARPMTMDDGERVKTVILPVISG